MAFVQPIDIHDLSIIKRFSCLCMPYWAYSLPIVGHNIYLNFYKNYFRLLKQRQFVGFYYYRLRLQLFILHFTSVVLSILLFVISMVLSVNKIIALPNPYFLMVITVGFDCVFFGIINTFFQYCFIINHQKQIWNKCTAFYQLSSTTLTKVDNHKLTIAANLILLRFLKKYYELENWELITDQAVTIDDDKILFIPKCYYQKYLTLGEKNYLEFIKQKRFLWRANWPSLFRNFWLKSSLLNYYIFILVINRLNPVLEEKKIFRKALYYYFTNFFVLLAFTVLIVVSFYSMFAQTNIYKETYETAFLTTIVAIGAFFIALILYYFFYGGGSSWYKTEIDSLYSKNSWKNEQIKILENLNKKKIILKIIKCDCYHS